MRTTSILTRKQLRELETELGRERDRLERALQTANEENTGTDEVSSGTMGSFRAVSEDGAIAVMLGSRTQLRYDAVMAALERLEAGTYGTCVGCAKPIPYGRLLVMPEAAYCVQCGGDE